MSLLTICIPTYNRIDMLSQLLEALLPHTQPLGIDVFVCDNASSDGTASFLSRLQLKYNSLKFSTNDQTVSIDQNMFNVMTIANSKYIFPLGDDDFLPSNSLPHILKLLEGSPDFLLLAFSVVDADLKPKKFNFPAELMGKSFDDPLKAFESMWEMLHFGSFIVKNELRDEWFAKYFGTGHAYSGVVWESLAEKHTSGERVAICCSDEKLVLIRDAGKTWSEYRCEIIYYGIPRWFGLLPAFYSLEVKKAKCQYFEKMASTRSLLKLRKKGEVSFKDHSKYVYFPEAFKIKLFVICLLPKQFARLVYRIYKLFWPRTKLSELK